jgi:hypothetical protein
MLMIDGAPQSLRVHQTTGAQVHKTRAASVRNILQAGTTTVNDVISNIAVQSSSTEREAIRFNSTKELIFQYGKFAKNLKKTYSREQTRGQPLAIGKNQ